MAVDAAETPETIAEVGEPYYAESPAGAEGPVPMAWEAGPSGTQEFYDHGDPTDYEQLMLERVNRARADPGAEAARLGIDLNEGLDPGTIADTPKPPLAMHRLLIDAARDHSQWMLDTNTFSHTGEGGSTVPQRIEAAGYELVAPWTTGENIAWGGTTGTLDPESFTLARHNGLFLSPGHRLNICNANFDEAGIGIQLGVFTSGGTDWNALMATQNFARSGATPSPFMLGAVYYDFNDNGLYDPGEGIAGITVSVAEGAWFTVTSTAGGYTLPMPAAGGTRTVTFDGPGLWEAFPVAFPGSINHKVDLALAYAPPVLSGSATPLAGAPNAYAVSPVPGATAIQVAVWSSAPAPADACDDLSRVIDETSPGYSALSTTIKHEGVGAYRFAHPDSISIEVLRYPELFHVGADAELRFRSRLGWATVDQHARVEVSADGSAWTAVYAQAGTGTSGESSFQLRSAGLEAFAGQMIWIRYNYRFAGGSYYNQTSDGVGWYVDAVEFIGLNTLEELAVAVLGFGESFDFTPPGGGDYLLVAQPEHFDRLWPFGPPLAVTATVASSYAAWAAAWESNGGLAAGTLADHPNGDHSGDGVPNRVAYALGLSPLACVVHLLPGWVAGATEPAYAYTVNTHAADISVAAELSTDMTTWHAPGAPDLGFAASDELFATEGAAAHRRVTFPEGPPPRVFARVRVE